MSPTFQTILDERIGLGATRQFELLVSLTATILIAVFGRRLWYAIPMMALVAVYFLLRCELRFEDWWDRLKESVHNDEDIGWVANHDGGGLIVASLENLFLALEELVLGVALLLARLYSPLFRGRKRLPQKPIDSDSPWEPD